MLLTLHKKLQIAKKHKHMLYLLIAGFVLEKL
jgi:hypothetical protein